MKFESHLYLKQFLSYSHLQWGDTAKLLCTLW